MCALPLPTAVFPAEFFSRATRAQSGFIEFGEFVRAMSSLSPRQTLDEKLKFTFALFDMNGTGLLEATELFQLLRMTTGTALNDKELQTVCDAYLARFSGGLDYNAFVQMFDVEDLNKLTLNLRNG